MRKHQAWLFFLNQFRVDFTFLSPRQKALEKIHKRWPDSLTVISHLEAP